MAKEEISNISSGSVYHIINQIQLDKTDEDTSRVPFTYVGWLSQRRTRWKLAVEKLFNLTLCWTYDYLSSLMIKYIHVGKKGTQVIKMRMCDIYFNLSCVKARISR